MDIDINYALAYYTTNVNIIGMNWKTYGTAFWYDTRLEDYHAAMLRAKDMAWNEIFEDFPHLKGTEIKYIETGELPVIDVSSQ